MLDTIFTKSQPLPETSLELSLADRLVEAHRAFRAAEAELADAGRALAHHCAQCGDDRIVFVESRLYTRIDAMTSNPARRELERRRDEALRCRNECLANWAQLKLDIGG